jgi:hypothetical protein
MLQKPADDGGEVRAADGAVIRPLVRPMRER